MRKIKITAETEETRKPMWVAEGEARDKVETARNLKQLGLKSADISKATGLSNAEIENL